MPGDGSGRVLSISEAVKPQRDKANHRYESRASNAREDPRRSNAVVTNGSSPADTAGHRPRATATGQRQTSGVCDSCHTLIVQRGVKQMEQLRGGRKTPDVRRIGDIVTRPRKDNSFFIHELLTYLEHAGFEGTPRSLGFDESGRHMLTLVPGSVPHRVRTFSDEAVIKAAELLRRFHDATAQCRLRAGDELVIHGDAGPHNLVFADGVPVALIDWDEAQPGRRMQDISSAIWGFTNLACDGQDPRSYVRHIRLFCAAYGGADPAAAVTLIDQDLRAALAKHTAAGRLTPASVFVPWVRWLDTHGAELLQLVSAGENSRGPA